VYAQRVFLGGGEAGAEVCDWCVSLRARALARARDATQHAHVCTRICVCECLCVCARAWSRHRMVGQGGVE
jgi:hypothetical protein